MKKRMYRLTEKGKEVVAQFLAECEALRKEILDAGIDTADDTRLPSEEDILADVEEYIDGEGDYYNGWGVTDYHDLPLGLSLGIELEREGH